MNRKFIFRFCTTTAVIGAIFAFAACSREQTTASGQNNPSATTQGGTGKGGGSGGGAGKSGKGGGGRGAGGGMFGGPMPVSVTSAKTDSFPIYINALGTATAWNTVTVKSRVDGTLVKIHFTEGGRVKAGDLLAEIDPRPYQVQLEQAQGQLARDQALLTNAKLDMQRYEDAREAVTSQQIDTARTAVAQYTGAVQIDQSAIDNAKLQLTYCRITSPIDGIAGLRMVDEGNLVQSGGSNNSIVIVTQDDPIAVFFNVPEDNLPALRRALDADASGKTLTVEAYDRARIATLGTGAVSALDNQIDTTTGTVRLKARFDNTARTLYPNQFVNIRLLVHTLQNVVIVPVTAVQINDQERYVFVVKDDQSVEQRDVHVGLSDATNSIITQGLAAGERVVVDGLDKLQNGARVIAHDANAPATAPSSAVTTTGTGAGTGTTTHSGTGKRGQGQRPAQ